jgi:hypothetical protein
MMPTANDQRMMPYREIQQHVPEACLETAWYHYIWALACGFAKCSDGQGESCMYFE